MEGANPHAAYRKTQKILDPPAHFVGGLVGEGHRQHGKRRSLQSLHQISDAIGQYPGFATARASQYQHRPRRRADCLALGIVQGIKNPRDIHSR